MNAIERKAWWSEAQRLLETYRQLLVEFECLTAALDEDDADEMELLEVLLSEQAGAQAWRTQ